MRCDDARARFDDLLSGTSRPSDRSRVREHLAACDDCRAEWEFAEILLRELAGLRSLPPLHVDVTDRVMRGIVTERAASPWPWAAATAAAILVALSAVGWLLAPTWTANAARIAARLAAKAAEDAPAWAAAGDALLEGLRRAAHAFLPDLRSMGNAQAVLVFLGHLLIGAVVAASMAIAHRVTPAARRRTGAGS